MRSLSVFRPIRRENEGVWRRYHIPKWRAQECAERSVHFLFRRTGVPRSLGRLQRFPELLTEFVQFGDLNTDIGLIIVEN